MSAASKFKSQRDEFYRDLAEAFAASESLFVFLSRRREFCDDQGQKAMADLYDGMITRMDESSNIADIIGDTVPAGDTLSLLSIDAAEDDNNRARMLRNLAMSIKRRKAMTNVLWKAMSGPAIAAPVVLAMPVLSAFQMPMYEEMIPPSEWGFWGQVFYWMCYVIRTYLYVIAAGLAGAIGWCVWSFNNWSGPLRSRFDRHLPYSLYRDMAAAGFLTAMAEYMANKTPMVAALEMLRERATPWMAERISITLDKLAEDPSNYSAAFDSGLLSPELHLRLMTYAERGNSRSSDSNDAFAEGLIQLGTDGLEHVADSVDKNAVWLTFASTVLTVTVLVVFYGGNTAIGTMISEKFTEQTESVEARSK